MASNQLPVAEKAKIISMEMNVPFERVREIQRKEVKNCTVEELKIRYNNPNLGKLPEWADFKKIDTIIWKIINASWTGQLEPEYSKDDIHNECWEKVLLTSKQILDVGEKDYEKFIYRIVSNHNSNFYWYGNKHSKYITRLQVDEHSTTNGKVGKRLLDTYTYTDIKRDKDGNYMYKDEVNKNGKKVKVPIIEEQQAFIIIDNYEAEQIEDIKFEEMDILYTVSSIQDTMLRDLISITAYLIAGIDYFEKLYIEAVHRLAEEKQFEIESYRTKENVKKLTFKKILKLVAGELSDRYLKKVTDYMQCFVKQNSVMNI